MPESNADLLIIRGLPGSGKSTLARKLRVYRTHRETDQFFYLNSDREYKFKPSMLPEAHLWCQREVREALQMGLKVVVSNTFTQLWEMEPYFAMCKELGKTFEVIEATGEFKNTHGVPAASIEKMKARWEPFNGSVSEG